MMKKTWLIGLFLIATFSINPFLSAQEKTTPAKIQLLDIERTRCYTIYQIHKKLLYKNYQKKPIEKKWLEKKYHKFVKILNLVKKGNYKLIKEINGLSEELLEESSRLQERRKEAIEFELARESLPRDLDEVSKFLVEMSAEWKLLTGNLYVTAKKYDLAKETYRSVIIRYTGEAWKSYVKRAEFGLEDLKSMMK